MAGTLPVSDHEGRALSTLTEFIGLQRTELQPPDEITRGLFGRSIRLALTHRVAADALAAAVLLALSTVWLVGSPFARLDTALIQTALIAPLAFRRVWPTAVFLAVCAIAFGQWLLNVPLLGDVALLVALYTVAAHQSRLRAAAAAGLLEVGVIMAAVRWTPAGTLPRSLLFLSATVVAALFAGRTVASGSRYLAWMDERARRLEIERDQQAVIAAAAERTRIARELHDIVSHSLSVVITLADAAAVVGRTDPDRGAEAMTEVSEVGRSALSDMRAMFGVLRDSEPLPGLEPQPGVAGLGALAERVRATGLAVDLVDRGHAVPARRRRRADRVPHRPGGADEHDPACRRPAARRSPSATTRPWCTCGSATTAPRARRRGAPDQRGARDRRDARAGGAARGHPAGRPGSRRRLGGLDDPALRPACGAGGVISVLLADDQPLLRRGFRMILEAEDGVTVAGEAGDGAEAVELARRVRPDVVLMDIRMPGTDGIEATRRITAAEPGVRVLVLTTFDLDEYAFGALQAGASGFLLKDVRPHELVAAVRTVASGDAVVSPRVTRRLLEEYAQQLPVADADADADQADRYPQLASLTEREREVLAVVAQGLSNTEIAASLFVSETTVKSHVGRILAKLGLRDRVQIVVLAYESGLVRPGKSK